jgi:hypothetical protein
MNLRAKLTYLLVAAALVVAGSVDRASANIVTVGQLGTINMTQGTQSGYITIPVFDAGGPAVQMTAWQIALRIVPLGGATGTVTIDVPSRTYGPNHVIDVASPPGAPYTVADTPTTGDVVFGSSTADFITAFPVDSSGQSLMNIKFNASGLALGNFDVRLVNQNENSSWTDGTPANQNLYVNGVEIPRFSTTSASLGTITVSAAAVPEPSSLLLSGAVVGFAGWRARRKKRKAAEAAATAESAPAA